MKIKLKEKFPLLISIPHGGVLIPPEVSDICVLSKDEIIRDGDEGVLEICSIEKDVKAFISAEIARVIVDLNRSPDDLGVDGVIKTHTVWKKEVYDRFPTQKTIKSLLEKYYYPYHRRLTELSRRGVVLGVDCHTMANQSPPIGPDPGSKRPWICLSNGNGTCPDSWFESLLKILKEQFNGNVSSNDPFKGGYIIRSHSKEIPWVQLELNRAPFMTNMEKSRRVICALQKFITEIT